MRRTTALAGILGIMIACTACTGTQQPETSVEETTQRSVAIKELHTAVKEAYGENYIPSVMAYDEETMESVFGISDDLYEEFVAEAPMISVHVDTFVAIKAAEGKAEEVEQLLTAYRENLVNNSMQYPMNLNKVEGSRVYRNGDYVFYIMLGSLDGTEEDVAAAESQNQIAVDVIEGLLGKAE